MPFNSEVQDDEWQAQQDERVAGHAARIAAEKEQADAEDWELRRQEMRERLAAKRMREKKRDKRVLVPQLARWLATVERIDRMARNPGFSIRNPTSS